MRYYIIAGEASGDMHAANLMYELNKLDTNADYRCWGGDLMEAQGGTIVKHYRDLAFMGFAEVAMNIKTIAKNLSFCKQDVIDYHPDVLILVDYPGFNLRIAEFAKKQGLIVFYYISPQIWAWKKSRVHKIKKNVDKVFCILPFEEEFYSKYDYQADYVGHPLLDELRKHDHAMVYPEIEAIKSLDKRPIIALLPGSRKQEITKMLPVMANVIENFPQYQFVIAGVHWQPETLYKSAIGNKNIPIVWGQTYHLLQNSHAALVTSGTATLETALFGIPQVILYKANKVSYIIAKQLVKGIKYISLPNLIMDKEVAKELIQLDCNPKKVSEELAKISIEGSSRNVIIEDYKLLHEKLGNGNASLKTAKIIIEALDIRK